MKLTNFVDWYFLGENTTSAIRLIKAILFPLVVISIAILLITWFSRYFLLYCIFFLWFSILAIPYWIITGKFAPKWIHYLLANEF
jgi:hypothetical protein